MNGAFDLEPAVGDISMRGVRRTLAVLRALNVRNGATVVELSRDTGISRGSLYRLLETLREEGYVALDLSGRSYCLTMLVRGLAEGFSDEDWITAVARPTLRRLQKKILWPADLATFMDNSIWIRETTRNQSPFTIDRGVAGFRFPMLRSASGRAYLAHCPENERDQILENLLAMCENGVEYLEDRPSFLAGLAEIRALGYGTRFGEEPVDSGAIAVPIKSRDRVLGCVTITFMRRALSVKKVVQRCLSDMQDAASTIAEGAEAMAGGDPVERVFAGLRA